MAPTQSNCDNTLSSTEYSADLDHPYRGSKCHRHKAILETSRRLREVKVVNTVGKELSSKGFARTLSSFKPSGGFHKKEITCSSNQVTVNFYSPLYGVSNPCYIKKWKCEDLISEETDSSGDSLCSPSVIGVKLNWKKDVKVQQISKFSRKTRNIEAEMTTTEFDFESKMKFQRELQTAEEEVFHHEKNLVVLDGNQCHGRITLKAKDVKPDEEIESSSNDLPPTFLDQEEHIILLVPFHTKTGFDSETDKRYNFPYHAKFSIGKKSFEHKFELRLALAQQPQHFGLIFTFPDEPQAITVKSLITVYSVFPSSPKFASLVTYTSHADEDTSSGASKSKKLVKNLTATVSGSLKEQNMNQQRYGLEDRFQIECDIAHPNRRYSEFSRNKSSLDEAEAKHKNKQRLLKNIKAEAREVR